MTDTQQFEDIRPYHDGEVRQVLDKLIAEREFSEVLLSMKYPRLGKIFPGIMVGLTRKKLKKVFASVNNVYDFQLLVRDGIHRLLEQSGSSLTVSGIEKLEKDKAYMFICNHRDIAMDPAFVNVALNQNGLETVRIAIGDNLLSKDYISDLMRINKSFIVKRSVQGKRAKLEALKTLSAYIRFSIREDNSSVWIAQREGRAKDGLDKTDTALLKMLSLSVAREMGFKDALCDLNVVPVSIAYEFDPCDVDKARELYAIQTEGSYTKEEHEDLRSIYRGIVGSKGRTHVAFGEPVTGGFNTDDELAALLDKSIISNYHLHATNILAYEMLGGADDFSNECREKLQGEGVNFADVELRFQERLDNCVAEHRPILLASYANPVRALKDIQGE